MKIASALGFNIIATSHHPGKDTDYEQLYYPI